MLGWHCCVRQFLVKETDQLDTELMHLLEDICNEDGEAFEALRKRYLPLIRSVLRRFRALGDLSDVDSDDLTQEAEIALYVAARTYNPDNGGVSFGSYAKVCVRNRLISALRRTHMISADIAAQSEERCCCGKEDICDPVEIVISSESCRMLMAYAKETFSEYEMTVFLQYLEGSKPSEIARALDRDRKSVANALFRIRFKLGRALQPP